MVTPTSVITATRDHFVCERCQDAARTGMQPLQSVLPERRGKIRFEMTRPLRYRVLNRGFLERVATGWSVNASSSGVLFEPETELKIGEPLVLLIDWPLPLEDCVRLQLVTAGRVVRVEGYRCAVTVDRYEFRTRATIHSGNWLTPTVCLSKLAVATSRKSRLCSQTDEVGPQAGRKLLT